MIEGDRGGVRINSKLDVVTTGEGFVFILLTLNLGTLRLSQVYIKTTKQQIKISPAQVVSGNGSQGCFF